MKLVDFILRLEQDQKTLDSKNLSHNPVIYNENKDVLKFAHSSLLKNVEKELYECDELKNVVRINFIDMPNYYVDKESKEPIAFNREFLGGETDIVQVDSFKFKPGEEIKFNKIVDLYSIQLIAIYNTKEEVKKPGVWIYPTSYNPETFVPINEIRVIWDPSQLEEVLKIIDNAETPKERIMRMFEQALDSMEPNIPCEYAIMIRCSARSINNGERAPKDNNAPQEAPIINADIPPIS